MTSQEISVGDVPVRAGRVTFVGELGWELYASAEYGADAVGNVVARRGSEHGLVAGGYRAIESLRLEKGYRVWGSDITGGDRSAQRRPGILRLPGTSRADSSDGTRCAGSGTPARPGGCACMTLDDPRMVVLGGEPVRVGGAVVGRVTSGGFGYTVGKSIAYGYLPVDRAVVGTEVAVDIFGEWVQGGSPRTSCMTRRGSTSAPDRPLPCVGRGRAGCGPGPGPGAGRADGSKINVSGHFELWCGLKWPKKLIMGAPAAAGSVAGPL